MPAKKLPAWARKYAAGGMNRSGWRRKYGTPRQGACKCSLQAVCVRPYTRSTGKVHGHCRPLPRGHRNYA